MLDTTTPLTRLIDEHRARINDHLRGRSSVNAGRTRKALADWTTQWHTITGATQQLTRQLVQIQADKATGRYTPQAIGEDTSAAVAKARATAAEAVETMGTIVDVTRAELIAASRPARPQPVDAAQAALVAEHRAGVKMVLDAIPANAKPLSERLLRFLKDAGGDPLLTWSLAGDTWVELYLESRGVHTELWKANVDQAIASLLPADAADAHHLLRQAIDHRYGLNGLTTVASSWANVSIDLVARGTTVTIPAEAA